MPAHAAYTPDDGTPRLAPVVSLDSRRGTAARVEPAPEVADLDTQARRHWNRVFEQAGLDLGNPHTGAVVAVVAKELERLVGGLLIIREGSETLPANPNAGVDLTSAMEVTGLLQDLARAAGVPQTKR